MERSRWRSGAVSLAVLSIHSDSRVATLALSSITVHSKLIIFSFGCLVIAYSLESCKADELAKEAFIGLEMSAFSVVILRSSNFNLWTLRELSRHWSTINYCLMQNAGDPELLALSKVQLAAIVGHFCTGHYPKGVDVVRQKTRAKPVDKFFF